MLLCGGLGMTLERLAYRPLYMRGATRLGPLISAVGASIFLQNAVMLTQGARMKVYMTNLVFPRTWRFNIVGVNVSALVIVIVAVSLLLMWGLDRAGPAHDASAASIRAVAEDREMAAVMGIDVRPRGRRSRSSSDPRSAARPASWSASTTRRSTSSWATRPG